MLCALATTLGLSLTASGRDRRVPLRAGPPLDGVDLAFGSKVWMWGFSARPGSVLRHRATVRPSLICPDLSQCGRGGVEMKRSVRISALLMALLVHEHRAVHCHARAERAHSGSMQCARICGLTATEPCVAMRQRSARILGAESCWRHCRVRSGALLGCCGDLLPDALDAVGLEVAVLRHHA